MLSLFNAAHAALAGASAGALALDVLVREARRADHREQARTCAGSRQRLQSCACSLRYLKQHMIWRHADWRCESTGAVNFQHEKWPAR